MECVLRVRTPEQKARKRINEERTIIDLQMAIQKERFRNYLKTLPEFHDGVKRKNRKDHDCWLR
ncbi:hypothetical protein [Nitrosopumilus sp. S4]